MVVEIIEVIGLAAVQAGNEGVHPDGIVAPEGIGNIAV